MSLEQEYKNIDFPQFSNVKESLRQRLHEVRRQKNIQAPVAPLGMLGGLKQELDWNQLDYMVAAGTDMAKSDDSDD